MYIKQIIQNFVDTYRIAKPIYENGTEVFENNLPLYPNYEDFYKVFVWLYNKNPEIIKKFENLNDFASLLELIDMLEPIKESLSEESKNVFDVILKMLQLISLCRRYRC